MPYLPPQEPNNFNRVATSESAESVITGCLLLAMNIAHNAKVPDLQVRLLAVRITRCDLLPSSSPLIFLHFSTAPGPSEALSGAQ